MGRGQGKVLFASRTPMGSDNVRTWLAMYPARSMQCMPLFPWTTASDAARNPQESTVQRACTRRAIPCGLAGREQSRCVRTSSLHTTVQDAKSKCLLCRGDPGARVASGWQRAAGSGQRAASRGRGTSPVPLSPLVAIWHRTCLGLSHQTKKGGVSRWLT